MCRNIQRLSKWRELNSNRAIRFARQLPFDSTENVETLKIPSQCHCLLILIISHLKTNKAWTHNEYQIVKLKFRPNRAIIILPIRAEKRKSADITIIYNVSTFQMIPKQRFSFFHCQQIVIFFGKSKNRKRAYVNNKTMEKSGFCKTAFYTMRACCPHVLWWALVFHLIRVSSF